MEHVKRCGMRGSDVLHSEHKLIMSTNSVVMMHGSVEYCMRSAAVHIRACATYTHALTRDHYCTSCTDVKRRVYETLQREQNGGLELAWSWVSL